MKQLRLTSIILLVLYIGFLFLPYLKVMGTSFWVSTVYDKPEYYSGIHLLAPLFSFLFIIPFIFLMSNEFTKKKRIWLIVFGSLILIKTTGDFVLVKIEYLFTMNYIGIGYYLNALVGIGFFVLSLLSLKIQTSTAHKDLLDSF